MDRLRSLLPLLLIAIGAVAAIYLQVPTTEPEAGISLGITSDGALSRAKALAGSQGIDIEGFNARVSLLAQRRLIRQLQLRFGIKHSNEMMQSSLPAYFWQVRFSRRGDEDIRIRNGSEQDVEALRSWLKGDLTIKMDGAGRVLSVVRSVDDTVKSASVSADSARLIASSFLRETLTGLEPLTGVPVSAIVNDSIWTPRRIEQRSRTDHEYQWMLQNAPSGNAVLLTVRVSGNVVTRCEAEISIPEEFRIDVSDRWQGIVVVFLWVAIVVAMVVISFRRFRAYEIGFRMAAFVGIVSALIIAFEMSLSLAGRMGWDFFVPVIMGSLFYGGALVITWAVSESIVRESWRDKMVAFDLAVNGHLLHSRIGASVVTGLCLGVAAYAVDLAVIGGLSRFTPVAYLTSDEAAYQGFAVAFPSAYVVAHAFYASTYLAAFFVLFLVSWLRHRIQATWLVVAMSAVALAISRASSYDPWWVGPIAAAGSSLIMVGTIFRFDTVAAFLAIVTMSAARQTALLEVSGVYHDSAVVLVIFFAVIIVSGVVSQFRRKELTDFDAITPAFARHITERERLQHELEIARTVQMSFLPKSNPRMARLDIASRCSPALEVGGDYYDFVELSESRVGVAVGDVSGKGTQAAFFMTLTKGFLRAIAKVASSPAKVLSEVNRHFYENVERGIFISLVYGIFDTGKSTLTVSRAGHNPVILKKSGSADTQVVTPAGLALGMDSGDTFEKSIQEVSIATATGDVFVFFTDGFPEAMDKSRNEYGENRLSASVARHADKSAAEIIDGIFSDMREFVGKAKQHDDLTIVVVKVV